MGRRRGEAGEGILPNPPLTAQAEARRQPEGPSGRPERRCLGERRPSLPWLFWRQKDPGTQREWLHRLPVT